MEERNRNARRNHGQELKKAVLDECRDGASVAGVAMAHGLNANLVHKWRRQARARFAAAATPPMAAQTFMPVAIASPAPMGAQPRELQIELRRGAIVATLSWPMSASAECAAWMREQLR